MKKFLITLGIIILSSCTSLFYEPDPIKTTFIQENEPKKEIDKNFETAPNNYLTIYLHLANEEKFSSSLYKQKNDKNLKYLSIFVEFKDPRYNLTHKIPIYLVDIENGQKALSLKSTLVSKIPISNDDRVDEVIKLQADVLLESYGNIIKQCFNISKDIIDSNGLLDSISMPGVSNAIDVTSEILELTIPEDRNMMAPVSTIIPEFDFKERTSQVQCFLFKPQDEQGNVLDEYEKEIADKIFVVKKDIDTGELLLFNNDTPYKNIPYLIVEYSFSDYLYDSEKMLPDYFSDSLIEINQEDVKKLKLLFETDSLMLNSYQATFENDLLAKASQYLLLKEAIDIYKKSNEGDLEYMNIIENYYQYILIPQKNNSHYYIAHYKSRFDTLDSAVENLMKNVKGEGYLKSLVYTAAELATTIENIDEIETSTLNSIYEKSILPISLGASRSGLIPKQVDIIQKSKPYYEYISYRNFIGEYLDKDN